MITAINFFHWIVLFLYVLFALPVCLGLRVSEFYMLSHRARKSQYFKHFMITIPRLSAEIIRRKVKSSIKRVMPDEEAF